MKTAIIGAGRMGRRHIQVVEQLGLDLVGIADESRDALRAVAVEHSIAEDHLFCDTRELLARSSPECVVIASTAPSHAELTCAAAEAGAKYVICEKPMAVSLAECDSMIESCRRHGARLAVNHQMRYMEQYTTARKIVRSEAFGGLSSVTVVAGNFGLAMNGSHYFEMVRYLTSEPLARLAAWLSDEALTNPRGPEFEDHAGSVRAITASGTRFYLDAGADQGHGVKVVYAGKYGHMVIDELRGTLELTVREAEYRELPTTRYGMPVRHETRTIEPADVIAPSRAVLGALIAEDDWPSGEDGRLAVAALVAAHVSNEDGHREVTLEEVERHVDRTFPWA